MPSTATRANMNRRRFIRQLGTTVVAAAGVSALPALSRVADAAEPSGKREAPTTPVTWTCCANAQRCGGGCGAGKVKFRCTAPGCTPYCTACQDVNPNCYTIQTPPC
jgi:hypothetical protein